MGRPRSELSAILKAIPGVARVYFQPPSGDRMTYPCITYTLDGADERYANNLPYSITMRYIITVIDSNPDSLIPGKVAQLATASFSRFYVADDLNHFVYTLYF